MSFCPFFEQDKILLNIIHFGWWRFAVTCQNKLKLLKYFDELKKGLQYNDTKDNILLLQAIVSLRMYENTM